MEIERAGEGLGWLTVLVELLMINDDLFLWCCRFKKNQTMLCGDYLFLLCMLVAVSMVLGLCILIHFVHILMF